MTKVILPRLNQSGSNEWSDVESNDVAIREVLNGGIDSENVKKESLEDLSLKSPNNAAYRVLTSTKGVLSFDLAAGTYAFALNGGPSLSGANSINNTPPSFNFAKSDGEVAGKAQKLRIRAEVAVNATKPTLKFTVGLYPVTVAGGADELKLTLGSVVAGSTVEFSEPAASAVTSGASGDFAIPADGAYVLGVVTSAILTNNSAVALTAQLQTRSV